MSLNAAMPMADEPATLAALQQRMQAHVMQGDPDAAGALSGELSCGVISPALADVADGGKLGPGRRLGIYHHAYRARLLETLRDTFSHTLGYLGDEWFDHLALRFIEQQPSGHANLRWYGGTWSAWLARMLDEGGELARQLGTHPEVAELAALDWALRMAFDAADAPVLSAGQLAAMPAEGWMGSPLRPQPSVQMLSVRHNSLSLWHALDRDDEVPRVEALAAQQEVLVWRLDERPHFQSVSPVEAQAVRGLLAGISFEALCAQLAEAAPDQDTAPVAAGLLRRWLDDGLLAAVAA
jgi:hypothetical protein